MVKLTPGANAGLGSTKCGWTLACDRGAPFGDYAGVALLPMNDKRQPIGEPALLHQPQAWMAWSGSAERVECSLDLAGLPAGSDRLLLMVYVYAAAGPVGELGRLNLTVDGQIEHPLALGEHGETAILVAEFYRRNEQWKVRALAEGSAYGLAAFGRRVGLQVDDRHPERARPDVDGGASVDAATGTGFAVSQSHILTCAHVIEGLANVHINSFEGRHRAEPVVVDRKNDLALLRVVGAQPFAPVGFRDGIGCELGESVVALGFPLAGRAGGGVQVTQGGVSGLFGPRDDASLLQFTAPIQPGSSGSPLFDSAGLVAGLVTSTMPDAQNMNFAVKAALVLAFLEAARVDVRRVGRERTLSTTELVRTVQGALWRVEASRF